MKVDTVFVKAVINAMKEDARAAVSSGKPLKSRYTFEHYCQEHQLLNSNDIVRMDERMIHCFRHTDDSPSLSYNESKGIWHCLACDHGGSFLDFVQEYEHIVLGSTLGFYQRVNLMLNEDSKLSAVLGRSSIYVKENPIESFEVLHKFVYRPGSVVPSSFLELSSRMLRDKLPIAKVRMMILFMQEGLSVEQVYRQVYEDLKTPRLSYDLNKMGEHYE